jgi:hypothetical protein
MTSPRIASCRIALTLCGLCCGVVPAVADDAAPTWRPGPIQLECVTDSTADYAGVPFSYRLDEQARQVVVSRWGEVADVVFGPAYITYRTLGMGTKMNVSISRETWRVTMIHVGGVYVVTGSCRKVGGD